MSKLPKIKYRSDYKSPDFTITDIDLDVALDPKKTVVTAVSKVTQLNKEAKNLILDGEDLQLISVKINEFPWTNYQKTDKQLELIGVPSEFTLTIVNEINPDKNTAFEGLYVSGDALCTQCEAEGFRHITYYLDRPDVQAKFTTKITANRADYPYLLANGNRISSGDLDDGKHFAIWHDPFPKPCYLFALVAGDFDVLRDEFITKSKRTVALEIYVDKGNLDRTSWAMTSLKNSMKWDEDRFNLEYDLDIFMIVAVDFFNMGAMENKGLNIFNSKFVLAKPDTATDDDYLGIEAVIGHEYFHNWTGNRVTCRDWFQLSLKEGLTVFRDQEFSADLGARAVKRIDDAKLLRTVQFAEDSSPMAHPIRPDQVIEMNNFYTVTVYEKGAEVIRMIHTLLGESLFQAGMKLYFERHDGSAATCDDFVNAMQDASKIDLAHFKKWYSQSGTPILTVTSDYNDAKKQLTLTINQQTKPTADQAQKEPLHIPLQIALYQQDGKTLALKHQNKAVSSVLNVHKEQEIFEFDEINEKPVIALLVNYSAPVILKYEYSDDELIFLMQHANDAFNRYDASQTLLNKYIVANVKNYQNNAPLTLPNSLIEAYKTILLSKALSPNLIERLIAIPQEIEIANHFEVVDPAAISVVRKYVLTTMANALYHDLYAVYKENITSEYHIDHQDIAKRELKNYCLYLMSFADDKKAVNDIIKTQYQNANNMTDSLAALSAAVESELECKNELMQHFDDKWHQDGLVMDKWFTLQAKSPDKDVLKTIKSLLNHRSFSLTNPNRTRCLIGSFVNHNPAHFHALDGSGYAFLAEILVILNDTNPQIASRLIDPLIRFKRYDETRASLMKQTLTKLMTENTLSDDLYEKVSKSLK